MLKNISQFPFERVLHILLILVVTVALTRIVTHFLHLYVQKKRDVFPSTSLFTNIVKLGLYSMGLLMVFQAVGISVTPVLTALGVGGLAVALGLQETFANLFAGLHILVARQVHLGDYVRLDSGDEGYICDIMWRNTTVRSLMNNIIIIPNAKVATAIITNYTRPDRQVNVVVPVGVGYGSDLEKVEKVTLEVAEEVMKKVPGGVPEYTPSVRFHTFGDYKIQFSVSLRAREFADQYLVKHEFVKRLYERYSLEGIQIPFPTQIVYNKGEGHAH